jgi:hypothetical protein
VLDRSRGRQILLYSLPLEALLVVVRVLDRNPTLQSDAIEKILLLHRKRSRIAQNHEPRKLFAIFVEQWNAG